MRTKTQKISAIVVIFIFFLFVLTNLIFQRNFQPTAIAQEKLLKTTPPPFDQTAALAELREQIKGREDEPAGKVFKNVQNFSKLPAGRLLAIMEFGYTRALGVDCTHCHTPEKWEAETKNTKQIAREMHLMTVKINGEMLPNIKSLGGRRAIINCMTCHRGELSPAIN